MDNQNIRPLVSVAVPVYNHEQYIVKAIESVLQQKTSFEFEIIIGDDHSTDKTREKLNDLKAKFNSKITLIFAEKNEGVNNNARRIFENCSGKYIAMLEGDDYWCYDHKLQRQVDFLEQNNEYSGCFHDSSINIINGNGNISDPQFFSGYRYYSQLNKYSSDFHSWDIIERNIIPTASLVFRNKPIIPEFFKKFSDVKLSLTWAFQIFIIGDDKFKYFNEVWSVYNDHQNGVSKAQPLNSFKISNIDILKRFSKEKYLKHKRNYIYKTICFEYRQILINPLTYQQKKGFFYKTLLRYFFYSIKSLRFELANILEYKKNQSK
jgi:glycosyltransferase involved in cell wall biosynthesis